MTLQNQDFSFICSQLMRHSLSKAFHLSDLLQMLNDYRMVSVEFFGNFSQRTISTLMLKVALFTIAKTWDYPKSPRTDERISKMWYSMEY